MPKPTALVKVSSRLLQHNDVGPYVHELNKKYSLRFVSGGGEQINGAFQQHGWDNVFGPLGRVCESFDQRLIAENVLKKNAAEFEDQLQASGLFAHMVIPVLESEVGQVTCHINGDLLPIICYNGYDKFFVLTYKEDVERKRWFYRVLWQICRAHLQERSMEQKDKIIINPNDYPEKIEVVGFHPGGM